jgi:uncharacterized protein with FMN-binding domain
MKKIFVSIFFVLGFILNAVYQRSVNADNISVGQRFSALIKDQDDDSQTMTASEDNEVTEFLDRNYFEDDDLPKIRTVNKTSAPSESLKTEPISVVATTTYVNATTSASYKTTSTVATVPQGKFKNGTYTGSEVDASYGIVQVKAIITNGKLSDVKFLSYPNDRPHSVEVSNFAMPILKQEAIKIQDANVDTISGASYTSAAFVESLGSALSQAL